MVDPTSDVGAVDEDEAPHCEVCGDAIVESATHRVRTWVDDENQAQHLHFCSDGCLAEWDEELPASAGSG